MEPDPVNSNDINNNVISQPPTNDIIVSMGQQINDLSLSLSKISIKNQQLEEQLFKQKMKACPNAHPLRYTYGKRTQGSAWRKCDICKSGVTSGSNVYWSCLRCDFDLCQKCGGHKRNVCAYNHPLQYIEKYPKTTFRCDICHTRGLKSGWHCQCDFDICQKCHDSY